MVAFGLGEDGVIKSKRRLGDLIVDILNSSNRAELIWLLNDDIVSADSLETAANYSRKIAEIDKLYTELLSTGVITDESVSQEEYHQIREFGLALKSQYDIKYIAGTVVNQVGTVEALLNSADFYNPSMLNTVQNWKSMADRLFTLLEVTPEEILMPETLEGVKATRKYVARHLSNFYETPSTTINQ